MQSLTPPCALYRTFKRLGGTAVWLAVKAMPHALCMNLRHLAQESEGRAGSLTTVMIQRTPTILGLVYNIIAWALKRPS